MEKDLDEHVGHDTPTVKGPRTPAHEGSGSASGGGVDADGFREPDEGPDPMLGQTIAGRYRLVDKIGQGGMGEVYLGLNDQLGQRVAVKFLSKRFADDESIVSRFLNEARSYCRVNHPNAVTLLDYGQHPDGTLYIITEFIEGKNLTETLKQVGPLPVDLVLATGIQLCEVLSAAHQQGVIHRDLKPDNLMLTPSSRGRYQVKVLDFGIAKIVDEDEDGPDTETGSVFGTPEFMSPEQSRGEPADPRSDIYAVGIILFYMLTGRLPFRGKNKLIVLNKQLHEAPPRPSEVRDDVDVPPRLEAVIMKCLNKGREARYPSADDLHEALEELQQPGGSSTVRVGMHAKTRSKVNAPRLQKGREGREEAESELKQIRYPTLHLGDGGGVSDSRGGGPDELGSSELDPHADTLAGEFLGGPVSAELESVEMWREHPSDRMAPLRRRQDRTPWIAAGVVGFAVALGAVWVGSGGEEVVEGPDIQRVLVTGQVMGTLAAVEGMLTEGSLDAAGRSLDLTRQWLADPQMDPVAQGQRSELEARLRRLVALRSDMRAALERGQCARASTLRGEMEELSAGLSAGFAAPVAACGKGVGGGADPAPVAKAQTDVEPPAKPAPRPEPVAAPAPAPAPPAPAEKPVPAPAPAEKPAQQPAQQPAETLEELKKAEEEKEAEEEAKEKPAQKEPAEAEQREALPEGMALPPKVVD